MWVLWGWLMVALSGVSIAAGVVGGLLAPSIVLDIVSFWPLFILGFVIAAGLLVWRGRGPARLPAIAPLILITALGAVVVLHIVGWRVLPSAAADMTGPPVGAATEATLRLELPGTVVVRAGAGDALYSVTIDRRGGRLGVPEAIESGGGDIPLQVDLRQRDGGRWFRTDGWMVRLSTVPRWDLTLDVGRIDADLTGLALGSLDLNGAGQVVLDRGTATVRLGGVFTLTVPAGTAVEVVGDAAVPAGWERTDTGARSPVDGTGLTIEVTDGARVEIQER